MTKQARRLDELERSLGPVVYGVQYAQRSDQVSIPATGERMSRAEFERRYPRGVVIQVEYIERPVT